MTRLRSSLLVLAISIAFLGTNVCAQMAAKRAAASAPTAGITGNDGGELARAANRHRYLRGNRAGAANTLAAAGLAGSQNGAVRRRFIGTLAPQAQARYRVDDH